MTPKEKYEELIDKYLIYFPEFLNDKEWDYNEDKAKQCALIADDYAIEFADWLIKRQTNYFESLKQLLEVFKKEKGL